MTSFTRRPLYHIEFQLLVPTFQRAKRRSSLVREFHVRAVSPYALEYVVTLVAVSHAWTD